MFLYVDGMLHTASHIFAFSIRVASEAFSNSLFNLRTAMMTYTVTEVVVHLNEVSNDLTRFIYKPCQILYF